MASRRRFPTFAVIILVAALVWLVSDLGYFNLNVPWIPLILIIVSLGWIFNRFS